MKYGMVNKPREEKMELKLKEGVNLSLLTTQHEIILSALELIDESAIHIDTEIKMDLMIALVNYMTEEGVIEYLEDKKGTALMDAIKKDIEPIFNQIMKDNEEYITYIYNTIKIYLDKNFTDKNSIIGLFRQMFDVLKDMTEEEKKDLANIVNNMVAAKEDKKIQDRFLQTKEGLNKKMEDLIKSYQEKPAE